MEDSKKIEHLMKQITEFVVEVPLPPESPEWENKKRKAIEAIIRAVEIMVEHDLIQRLPECPGEHPWFPPIYNISVKK